MSDTRGVFSLRTIVKKKILSDWVELNVVWVSPSPFLSDPPNTGYFGGGAPAPYYSTMDKVTYSTDTTAAVPGAALSVARHNGAATGNSTAGYFGGGYDGSNIRSTMDKVTYSTDTTAQVPGAALSVARGGHDASSARANALPGSAPVVV